MTLKTYLDHRFGHHDKSLDALIYMLRVSLFAPSFREFWQRWNPLWSYYILFYVYRPLSRILPKRLAGLFTFVVSGFLHDCVAMALTADFSIVMTAIFSSWGIIILGEDLVVTQNFRPPILLRPLYQLFCLSAGALPALHFLW